MKAENSLDSGFCLIAENSATFSTSFLEHVGVVGISRCEHICKSCLVEPCFTLAVMLYDETGFITVWIDIEFVQLPFDVDLIKVPLSKIIKQVINIIKIEVVSSGKILFGKLDFSFNVNLFLEHVNKVSFIVVVHLSDLEVARARVGAASSNGRLKAFTH